MTHSEACHTWPCKNKKPKKPQLLNTAWYTNKDGPAIFSNTWDALGWCCFLQLKNALLCLPLSIYAQKARTVHSTREKKLCTLKAANRRSLSFLGNTGNLNFKWLLMRYWYSAVLFTLLMVIHWAMQLLLQCLSKLSLTNAVLKLIILCK